MTAIDGRRAPGPLGVPLLGNVLALWSEPLRLLLEAHRDYGDIVRFNFGPHPFYLVNDVGAIRRVLIDNAKGYVKSRNYQGLKLVLGEGLVTSEGELWRRQRRLAQPAFLNTRIGTFAGPMARLCEAQADLWERLPEGAVVDVHEAMSALTFRIVGRTLLDADFGGEADHVGPVMKTLISFANDWVEAPVKIPTWVPTPANLRFKRAKRIVDDLVLGVIEDRRRCGEEKEDLLGLLMSATDEGESMSETQLRDEVVTLVMAGHETTANALSFTWYLLSLHPAIDRRLAEELDHVLGGRAPALDDLPKLELTERVIREAMRLYPPAWAFERSPIEGDELCGYAIEPGSTVGIAPWTLHRHVRHWPDPEGFDPDRFLPEASKERSRFAYLPFGAGARQCIGMGMAIMEAKIVLATLRQRFRLDLVPGHRVELDPSVTLRPKNGVKAWLRKHTRPSRRASDARTPL
ncbi:MAG: cytochrome P450 [Sandaracinaceae bacterium]|nr:cytochrome P450 [Sandaracinaceae bacterium]